MIKHISTGKDKDGLTDNIIIEADGDDFEAITGVKPSRREHIKREAEQHGVGENEALMIAELLGENEDCDGLLSVLDDYQAYERN